MSFRLQNGMVFFRNKHALAMTDSSDFHFRAEGFIFTDIEIDLFAAQHTGRGIVIVKVKNVVGILLNAFFHQLVAKHRHQDIVGDDIERLKAGAAGAPA